MNKYRVRIYRSCAHEEEVYREVFAINRIEAFDKTVGLANEFDERAPIDRQRRPRLCDRSRMVRGR